MDVNQIVGALIYLEKQWGSSPSVEQIAEQAGCSTGTAYRYLKQAVEEKLIVQNAKSGKFMSHSVAKAFGK